MTHPLSEDTLALPSSPTDSRAASNRLTYHPPFLTALAVNSQTTGNGKPVSQTETSPATNTGPS